jgi:hypothetical protein
VFLTGVRSAILASMVYLLITYLSKLERKAFFRSITTIALVFIVLMSLIIFEIPFFKNIFNYQFDTLLTGKYEEAGKGRIMFAKDTLDKIRTFDVTSLFFGDSASSLYKYFFKMYNVKSWPHNDYITVFYLYGAIGFVGYVYYMLFKPMTLSFRSSNWKLMAIILALVVLAYTNGYYTYSTGNIMALVIISIYNETLSTADSGGDESSSEIPVA